MRIAAFLQSPESHRTLRVAFPAATRHRQQDPLHFLQDWGQLLSHGRSGRYDVFLIELDSHENSSWPAPTLPQLEELRAVVEPQGIVLYVHPPLKTGFLTDLGRMGFPFLVFKGIDDDAGSLLRVLARAAVRRRIFRLLGTFDDILAPPTQWLLLETLSGWPAPGSVRELAKSMGKSPRTLRRDASEGELPCPRELLRWARLLEAAALAGLGVRSPRDVSLLVGLEEVSSLHRLSQDLCGESPRRLFEGSGLGKMMEAFRMGMSRSCPAFLRSSSG